MLSKYKATMLLDVKDANNIDINTGDSSVQIVRIKTDKELTVLGCSAIDDELVTGSPKDNGDATTIWENGQAVNTDSIDHRRVESPDNAFFTIYADDETGKSDSRDDKLANASDAYFGGGDDTAYLMNAGANAGDFGNGAILHIGIK